MRRRGRPLGAARSAEPARPQAALLIQRAASLGEEKDTKTRAHRTVQLLAPLREDLLAWRMRGPAG